MIVYGSTPNFVISYDSSFSTATPSGSTMSQAIMDMCEYDLTRLSMLFGGILPPPANLPIKVQLIVGSGGASNNEVNNIWCNCNSSTYLPGLPSLVVAELAEILMNVQTRGWVPGYSNGEALSRVSAQILYPSLAWLWSTGQSWLSGDPMSPNAARSNFVDNVWHSDQDSVSTGCGSIFLNYLAYQLGYKWTDIYQAGAPTTNTLKETATTLGVTNAWTNFINLINTNLPPGASLPAQPTSFGQPPEPTDNPFPYGTVATPPLLYMRHNLADTGTSHTGSLADSPDIILKNSPVSNPQATYSTPATIASDTESDPDVLTGQANTVYLRVWNRGGDATNVFATVYWSPPATLVTPNMWTLIGDAYYPDVPAGSIVEVSVPGVNWPADVLPGVGHDCFVAAVGNAYAPAPNPGSFANFTDYENYIYANNNITWRNFNVIAPPPSPHLHPIQLPFQIVGAWDEPRHFEMETHAELPSGSLLTMQVAEWIGCQMNVGDMDAQRLEDSKTDPDCPRRLKISLPTKGSHKLGKVELPKLTAAPSFLSVHIPEKLPSETYKVYVRQLSDSREIGRITWLIHPRKRSS